MIRESYQIVFPFRSFKSRKNFHEAHTFADKLWHCFERVRWV